MQNLDCLYTQSKYTTTLDHNWAKKWQDFLLLICPLPLTKNALSKLSRLTNKWRHSFQWKRRGTIGWNIFLRSILIYRYLYTVQDIWWLRDDINLCRYLCIFFLIFAINYHLWAPLCFTNGSRISHQTTSVKRIFLKEFQFIIAEWRFDDPVSSIRVC